MIEESHGKAESIATVLREEIEDGTLPPGVKLPERSLATRFETTRSTVARALELLEKTGLAHYVPNKGVFVSGQAGEQYRDPEAFERLLLPLHEAFLRAAEEMRQVGPNGKNYWDILHAAQELLEAMGHLENAAFEWRSYAGRLDEETNDDDRT